MSGRRNFIKTLMASIPVMAMGNHMFANAAERRRPEEWEGGEFITPGAFEGMPIKATFLDEISWDIPHQNWGVREWDKDFQSMKKMGINTVVLIRAGLGKWISAPFKSLLDREDLYYPSVDLVEMFLTCKNVFTFQINNDTLYCVTLCPRPGVPSAGVLACVHTANIYFGDENRHAETF